MAFTNVAAAANGGTATASSTINSNFPAVNINDGNLASPNWGSGSPDGGWNSADNTPGTTVQVDFDSAYTITQVDAATLQSSYSSSTPPAAGVTLCYERQFYKVQLWNGSSWVDVSGLDFSVSGDTYAYTQVTGLSVSASKIRVLFNSASSYFRWVELQAWATTGGGGGGGNPWYAYAQQRIKTSLGRTWRKPGLLWTPDYAFGKVAA